MAARSMVAIHSVICFMFGAGCSCCGAVANGAPGVAASITGALFLAWARTDQLGLRGTASRECRPTRPDGYGGVNAPIGHLWMCMSCSERESIRRRPARTPALRKNASEGVGSCH
jgi:hypothetical protein